MALSISEPKQSDKCWRSHAFWFLVTIGLAISLFSIIAVRQETAGPKSTRSTGIPPY